MARGGYRPGAGRPKGSKTVKQTAAVAPELTPLEFMLAVMRDETADPVVRQRMAIAAAPFVHHRTAERLKGKRVTDQEAAEAVVVTDPLYAPGPPPSRPMEADEVTERPKRTH